MFVSVKFSSCYEERSRTISDLTHIKWMWIDHLCIFFFLQIFSHFWNNVPKWFSSTLEILKLRLWQNDFGETVQPPKLQFRQRSFVQTQPCRALLGLDDRWKQDPVSTLQKTGWTNYSSFLVWSGLEKGFTLIMITKVQGAVNNHFHVYKAIFGMVTTNQTTGWS